MCGPRAGDAGFQGEVNNPVPAGVTQIINQGTVFYDSDGDGINDSTQQTDGTQ